jgi:aminodeoxyfutalosine synthase
MVAGKTSHNKRIGIISDKIKQGARLEKQDALVLFDAPLSLLSELATSSCQKLHGDQIFFIRNSHIEPTNICKNRCTFCSFCKEEQDKNAYSLTLQEILKKIEKAGNIREIHIVGGVNKNYDLKFYKLLFEEIRKNFPTLHRKGLTAEEIAFLSETSELTIEQTITELIESGLESMPGGGAEIFNPTVRKKICPKKITGKKWLEIHQISHNKGLKTNATMLYGHIESRIHRIEHLDCLRKLQVQTSGFNAFIPLKYKKNSDLLHIKNETALIEDLKVFAISRIFLDNIPHIKTYWPNIGFNNALLTLDFGANDMDGTVSQSTAIYENTGNIPKGGITPEMLIKSIKQTGKKPVERDSAYKIVKTF